MGIEDRLRRAGLPPLRRLAWIDIDLDALTANLGVLKGLAGAGVRVAPVVKADGYGHGLPAVGRCLEAAGADALCVSSLDEALALRDIGLGLPLVCLYPIPADGVIEAAMANIQLSIFDLVDLERVMDTWAQGLDRAQQLARGPLELHLAVETGFHRGGLAPRDLATAAGRIAGRARVRLVGVWSHLASPEDPGSAARQGHLLEAAVARLGTLGQHPPVHLAASGGLFAGSAASYSMVRPGLAVYGHLEAGLPVATGARSAAAALRPAMSLKARPVALVDVPEGMGVGYGGRWRAGRDSRIAVLPLGYADGLARSSQPDAEALVKGRRVPLVGAVSMDSVHADVTDVPGVGYEDEFVLLGEQGGARIRADELARRRNTITWEVLSTMAARLARVYHSAAGTGGSRTISGEWHGTRGGAP